MFAEELADTYVKNNGAVFSRMGLIKLSVVTAMSNLIVAVITTSYPVFGSGYCTDLVTVPRLRDPGCPGHADLG